MKTIRRYPTLAALYANAKSVGDCLIWSGQKTQDGYGLKTSLLIALVLAFPVAAGAGHPPARHGSTAVSLRVCESPVTATRQLVNTSLLTLTGHLGKRELHYWNESPSTSYLYGVNTFVVVNLHGKVLSFRAVRLVPVCAPLRIAYSW